MEITRCHECKKNTIVVEDHRCGDLVCTECGLVLKSSCIDERPDWQTFELNISSTYPVINAQKMPQNALKKHGTPKKII